MPVNNIDAESNGLFYDPYNEIKDEDIERLVKSITDKLDTEDRNLYIDRFVNKTDYNVLADKYTVSEQAMRKRVSRLRARILKIIHELLGMIIMLIII